MSFIWYDFNTLRGCGACRLTKTPLSTCTNFRREPLPFRFSYPSPPNKRSSSSHVKSLGLLLILAISFSCLLILETSRAQAHFYSLSFYPILQLNLVASVRFTS